MHRGEGQDAEGRDEDTAVRLIPVRLREQIVGREMERTRAPHEI